ncbi:MAG: hypothetical protein NZ561_02405 [Phycisphaerae bacterium]|nr:hypothetical protein [Phycisphaerae bacterium]MDW8262078.1 hypothetical protein [Phycisphaerales bacterium]
MTFSWTTFLILLFTVVVTFAMTGILAARWTTWRRYFALRDWARSRRLRLLRRDQMPEDLPEGLAILRPPLRLRWHLTDGCLTLMRAHRAERTCNLLLLRIAGGWPATGLRSARRQWTALDWLELFSFPSSHGAQRFTLHGREPIAARRLSDSLVRGLLPPDLSILLDGNVMLIDFSDRPFDPIELDRIITLSRQIAAALPPVPRPTAAA